MFLLYLTSVNLHQEHKRLHLCMVPLLRLLNLFQFFCHLLHLFLQPL
jgi:hypothetical protein